LLDRLRDRGWDDADLEGVPRSWAVVGSVILADFEGCPREREGEVGRALLELHGGADTVLAREGIEGEHREPSVRTVAGAGDTETVHTEHGTEYALDLARVMFSPGNKAERARMGEIVEEGERVLDMFAGVGYFTLPMARAGARVTAIERNPTAFRYLLENSVLNGVQDRVDAYRADCRDVAIEGVDRVVMGCFDAVDYLDPALDALASDGILHVHAAVDESALWETPVDAIEAAAAGRDRSIEVLDRRVVKGCGEGFEHVVVDVRVA
jgi:tRNA wybutosine-synthesizing protein 2